MRDFQRGALAFLILVCIGSGGLLPGKLQASVERQTERPAFLVSQQNPTSLKESMEWLGSAVEGATAESGGGQSPRHSHRYEDFEFEDCAVRLREHRQSYERESLVSTTIEEITIPLSSLSNKSVRVDRAGKSVHLVSVVTLGLRPLIVNRQKVTYQNGQVEQTSGAQTGFGIYFKDRTVARRASRILLSGITVCRRTHRS